MFILRPATFIGALASIVLVNAHGTVTGILADGSYFGGFLIGKYPYISNPPDVAGWSTIATTMDMWMQVHIIALISYATATRSQELQLRKYLLDKTTLKFFKIQAAVLVDGSKTPCKWASDDLIANNNTWKLTIPKTIAPGNYCFNLKITSGGTAQPQETAGTALSQSTHPGIKINIYDPFSGYKIPGPSSFSDSGNSGGDQSPSAIEPANQSPSSPAFPIVTPTTSPGVPEDAPATPTATGAMLSP
ncbi:hypothetical protein ACJ72_03811 [Emergomyces africanus]|uniref:Auxiliary Activity family 9 catalytic domain-containing protein n=1 Tax=Emergomyces africanus TaxID=1955775 RepID=A0A1B7NYJ8_9EURO|nr:hypothetical protein ACJ72_03811 [Emergomyces africanus]